MDENEPSSFSVQQRCAQYQENLNSTTRSTYSNKVSPRESSVPSKPPLPNGNKPEFVPAVPPHRDSSNTIKRDKPIVPPKPLHITASSITNLPVPSTSSASPRETAASPPRILLSPVETSLPFRSLSLSRNDVSTMQTDVNRDEQSQNQHISNDVHREGVRDKAKMFESIGFVPRFTPCSSRDGRPISEVSTLSLMSQEDEFSSASEDETECVHRSSIDDHGVDTHSERKSTSCNHRHAEIMDEMARLGIVRNSWNKKGKSKTEKRINQSHSVNDIPIPSSIGKIREEKGRHDTLTVSASTTFSSQCSSRIDSIASDRSSTATTHSGENIDAVPDYDVGDEAENKRLKKLHYAAIEFYTVQMNFVRYLDDMSTIYPEYMERYGKRIGKDLLAHQNGQDNVVLLIQKSIKQILPFHELLLHEFKTATLNWDSRHPVITDIILRYADVLKSCTPFLSRKAEFAEMLIELREENRDFDEATYMFETEVFKRGSKGAVLQQLDQVHQNFMRYKILMMRYNEYLVEGSEESRKGAEAVRKLEEIAQKVNQQMGLPSNSELSRVYDRLQGAFNVFEAGRHLIRQCDVFKQTRKESQPRVLILFTDCLWLCRASSSLTSSGGFDMSRSYKMPIEGIRVELPEGDDYSTYLNIKSKSRSAIIIFPSEKERDQWRTDIQNAHGERRRYLRRQSEAIIRQQDNARKRISEETPCDDSDETRLSRPTSCAAVERSRSHSFEVDATSGGSTSAPDTPIDDPSEPFKQAHKVVEEGESNGQTVEQKKKKKVSELVKPIWLPDKISNVCLMQGCSTEFSFISRRHHCRNCGWLICKDCKGQAPLSKFDYQKQIVCPECYDSTRKLYDDGTLFPSQRLVSGQNSRGESVIRVRIGNRMNQQIVDPPSLFKEPFHIGFKKINIDAKRQSGLVFGKVYLKRKGNDMMRFALLTADFQLKFYRAELDVNAAESVMIHGYELHETDLDNGGWMFELVHQNQIRTSDKTGQIVAFRVETLASAKKWSKALQKLLQPDD